MGWGHRRGSSAALCALGMIVGQGLAAQDIEFERPAPGVLVALTTNMSFGNATVFSGTESSLVVDSHIVPALAELVLAEIGGEALPPVQTVVNTHWHADHSHGNSAYAESSASLVILASEATARGVREDAAEQLARWPAFFQQQIDEHETALARDGISDGERAFRVSWLERGRVHMAQLSEPRFVPPNRVFTSDTTVDLGGRVVQVLHVPGHTDGDVVVWDPQSRVLAAGDLILDQVFMGIESPRVYRESLARVRALDPLWIVPGHGPVREGADLIDTHIASLDRLLEAVDQARADGLDVDATVARVTPMMAGSTLAGVEAMIGAAYGAAAGG